MEVGNDPLSDRPPRECRFQVQGPDAKAVLTEVSDGPLPDITGFEMGELTINGHDLYALGHGMAGSYGIEISGDFEYHEDLKQAILDAGDEYGIRQLGTESYLTSDLEIGWISNYHPAIYEDDEFEEYREWLTIESLEANYAISGSFDSEDITDYYLNPVDLGYDYIIDFDHDFIGKEALRDKVENPDRTRVSFIWNDEDVMDIYGSLFEEGESYKYIQLPNPTVAGPTAHYDRVEKDGENVGVLKSVGYLYPERSMIGVGVVDVEFADPGTEVTVIHGQEQSTRPSVERHVNKDVRATVRPSPLHKDRT